MAATRVVKGCQAFP